MLDHTSRTLSNGTALRNTYKWHPPFPLPASHSVQTIRLHYEEDQTQHRIEIAQRLWFVTASQSQYQFSTCFSLLIVLKDVKHLKVNDLYSAAAHHTTRNWPHSEMCLHWLKWAICSHLKYQIVMLFLGAFSAPCQFECIGNTWLMCSLWWGERGQGLL